MSDKRMRFLNTHVDNLTMEEAVEEAKRLVLERRNSYVVTPNVDHIVKIEHDRLFREIYDGADLVLTDGKPLIWMSRLMGMPIKEKISGSDYFPEVCKMAAKEGFSVFLLGAAEGVAKKAGKPSGSGGDKEDGRNPGTASAAEKGPEGRLGAAPKQKENGKPEEKSGTDGMDAGTPETESTDAGAVVEAVLTPGQQEIVNSGRTIEIRIEVTDISEKTPAQDKEMIESGIEAHREEAPGLVLGMYVAISMFVRIGEEEWNVVTETKEPIEVVMGIPEKLLSEDRKFYIIRAHNGEYTFMDDLDSEPDTITIRTDLFSSYAIAYVDTEGADSGAKCSLCHICPALFGVCCFIWLAVILAVMVIVILVAWRRRKAEEPGERKS